MGKGAGDACRTAMTLAPPAPAAAITEQFARELYSAKVGPVYGEVHGVVGDGSYFSVVGRLVDAETGVTAGRFSRLLTRRNGEWIAHHGELKVVEELRGQGIARQLLAFQEREYRRAGIRTIELNAEWHGAAYWLSQGFEPTDPEDARHGAWLASRKVLDPDSGEWVNGRGELLVGQLHARGLIDAELAEQARQLFAPDGARAGEPLSEAVNLGRDRPWKCAQGRTLWLGRMVMAGADYEAVKPLD